MPNMVQGWLGLKDKGHGRRPEANDLTHRRKGRLNRCLDPRSPVRNRLKGLISVFTGNPGFTLEFIRTKIGQE